MQFQAVSGGVITVMIGRFKNRLAKSGVAAMLRSDMSAGLDVDVVFGAEAGAFDDAGVRVMQQPIEQRGGERGVVVEDFRPVLVGPIGISYLELDS
jgi:hypothetical protein